MVWEGGSSGRLGGATPPRWHSLQGVVLVWVQTVLLATAEMVGVVGVVVMAEEVVLR